MAEESKKYTLTKENVSKVGKGALIAVGGAFLTFLAQAIGQFDFGEWTPAVVALASILINVGRKWLDSEE